MLIQKQIRLLPIQHDGSTELGAPAELAHILEVMPGFYAAVGFTPPWIGYLTLDGERCVGTCAFKSATSSNRVEIAYHTLPAFEGKGYATVAAQRLIEIARSHNPSIQIFAQTLPEENASTKILKRLGFDFAGEVQHPEDGLVWEWTLPVNAAL